ncbi:reverse transcriptase family protein [Stenotrophomonas sp. C-A]|nr:RNA-directed DNA polymerase [Stenotrophomonas maltophilia]MBN5138919.1 RNA-directed DNA polymerase [Stenotrophomonas maltophilia]
MNAHSLHALPSFEEYKKLFVERYVMRYGNGSDDGFLERCLEYSKNLLSNGLPVIFSRQHLCALLGYEEGYIDAVANSPHLYYREFEIPKRSGEKRLISEPLPSLKEVQRWIYKEILLRVPVSSAAKAFVPRRKVRDAARFHARQKHVLKIDIADFFPSITRDRVFGIFRLIGYSSEVSSTLARLCCVNESLPQGGVCSAYLSNVVLRSLDGDILKYCRGRSLRYTRYADDFIFSGDSIDYGFVKFISSLIVSHGFNVNPKKTTVMGRACRQVVVGHVVNDRVNAPREYRRRLRQIAYFIAKHGMDSHLSHISENRSGAREHYLGRASFVISANPRDRDALFLRNVLTCRMVDIE